MVDQFPLRVPQDNTFRLNKNDLDARWPASVSRTALYNDYLLWHKDVFLKNYMGVGYYKDNPHRIPLAAPQLEFFSTLGPCLYVIGNERQVRAYKVYEEVHYEGKWIKIAKNRYFIRLCAWTEHCAAYELLTGVKLSVSLSFFPIQARQISNAQDREEEETRKRRMLMAEAMRRD